MPTTWSDVDRYVRHLDVNWDPTALEQGASLALAADPDFGVVRFARLVLARGIAAPDYRQALEQDAKLARCSVCSACFEFVPSPFVLTIANVRVDGAKSVQSDSLTVRFVQGIWADLTIQGGDVAWEGPNRLTSVSQRGAWIAAAAVLLGPLAILVPAILAAGSSLAPVLFGFWLLTICVILSIAVFFRPRIVSAVDAAWEIVVPRLLLSGPTRPAAAFVAGLATASVGRGSRSRRSAALRQAIDKCERLVEGLAIGWQYLCPLYRLAISDSLQLAHREDDALETIRQLVNAAIGRRIPVECLDAGADDEVVWASQGERGRLIVRYYVCAACYEAGYSVSEVLALTGRSRTLERLLAAGSGVSKELLAYWFATLSRSTLEKGSVPMTTVFDLARRGDTRLMATLPDALAESRDGAIRMSARGILYGDELLESPLSVDVEPIQEFFATGWRYERVDGGPDLRYRDNPRTGHFQTTAYSLTVNGRKYRHATDPSPVAAELREWGDIFFGKVRPSAEDFLRKGKSGRLPHPEMGRFTVCPSCGQTVVFRAGEISESVAPREG